jgi:ferredoxin-NADP reductase
MVAAHAAASDPSPFRLIYSVPTPAHICFRDELAALVGPLITVDYVSTQRRHRTLVRWSGASPKIRWRRRRLHPTSVHTSLCGSTDFAETVVTWLLELGHSARDILTERYEGL